MKIEMVNTIMDSSPQQRLPRECHGIQEDCVLGSDSRVKTEERGCPGCFLEGCKLGWHVEAGLAKHSSSKSSRTSWTGAEKSSYRSRQHILEALQQSRREKWEGPRRLP